MSTDKKELLESLKNETENLEYKDGHLGRVKKRAEMLIRKIFGDESNYLENLKSLKFSPSMAWSGMDKSYYRDSFYSGKNEFKNLITVMQEDLVLSEKFNDHKTKTDSGERVNSKNIFIVHGHNEELKESCARFVEKIDLKPIILHEQPNKGRTIIEKFTDYSDVSFAIVLLSADDLAFTKNEKPKDAKFRARQNVILELGFFLGKIGRERVVVLYQQAEKFEIPSDYQGVIFIPYDINGNWRFLILREMKEIGYNIDANKIL